jgi:hypothetical protein
MSLPLFVLGMHVHVFFSFFPLPYAHMCARFSWLGCPPSVLACKQFSSHVYCEHSGECGFLVPLFSLCATASKSAHLPLPICTFLTCIVVRLHACAPLYTCVRAHARLCVFLCAYLPAHTYMSTWTSCAFTFVHSLHSFLLLLLGL